MEKEFQKIKKKFFSKYSNFLILKNVFKTNFDKNCLILYIIQPFFIEEYTHTNQPLVKTIAKVFCELGYNIDIADYSVKKRINFDKYIVVFGFGRQFDHALTLQKIKTVAFLTGAIPYYSNWAELSRSIDFKKRNGMRLKLRRQCNEIGGLMNLELLQNAAAAICTGNDWTCMTWGNIFSHLYKITATGFDNVKLDKIHRNIADSKKNFLWCAGSGNLHKGLDLCIEVFRTIPDVNLYIAGTLDDDFQSFYKKDFQSKNIHYVGFVHINSNQYKFLCKKCLFSILPSCSEGMASSVLTNMFSGMIPIVTEQSGVDIGEFGFKIEDVEVISIVKLVKKVTSLSNDELQWREKEAYKYAMKNHTLKKFKKDLYSILNEVLA